MFPLSPVKCNGDHVKRLLAASTCPRAAHSRREHRRGPQMALPQAPWKWTLVSGLPALTPSPLHSSQPSRNQALPRACKLPLSPMGLDEICAILARQLNFSVFQAWWLKVESRKWKPVILSWCPFVIGQHSISVMFLPQHRDLGPEMEITRWPENQVKTRGADCISLLTAC